MPDLPKLWVPPRFAHTRMRPRVRTVTLRDGRRAKVTVEETSVDGESSVTHVETSEGIDAIVRPKTIVYKIRPQRS